MNEYKKKYFISVLGANFDFQIIEDTWDKDVVGHDRIQEFLQKADVNSLWAYVDENDGRNRIRFQNENASSGRVLVFSKIKPMVLNDENLISSMQVITLQGPPTTALYHALNNVFSPLIIKSQKRNANQNSIERQLANLQAGLRNTILTNNLDLDPLRHVDANSLSVILTLEHEVEFWNSAINNGKNSNTKTSYASLRDILKPLSRDLSVIDALPLPEVEDLLENAHNVLDDLWRHEPPYPKVRMEHLMEIIASDVIRRLSRDVAKIDFWTEDFNTTRDVLEQCLSTGNRWINTCKQLTHIFWPNYSLHAWSGGYFIPMNLADLTNGLGEILNIRTIHKQLTRLLTVNEQRELVSDEIFNPFKDLDVLNFGPHTEQEWRTAKKQFEYLLRPAEEKVAQKLKKQFGGVKANTRQLVHDYGRYSELISRPTVKQALQNERQYLLETLREYVEALTRKSTEAPSSPARFDTPQFICELSTIRQIEAQANEILRISRRLLDDLQNYDQILHNVTELLNNVKQQHTELFESWCSDTMLQIKNKTLSLKENDPVIQFSEDKLMRVSYSPGLVSMISEVRQLSAMGYKIPRTIEDTYLQAKKFMKYAKILEQIANFHNTIGDRMIPSQRPLMLASALNLSRLVQEEEVVYWSDVTAVEKYIDKLKVAVENLSSENNLLTNYHLQISAKIRDLENVDLIRHYQKWKDAAKNVRESVSQVQNKGFKSLQSWKVDLDRQLAKILEMQYLKSLHTVHLYLPEIYADLIYRDGHLQYSPDEKTLREKYANQMKRFLDIPKSFRGVSENSEIFAEIIDRSKYEIDKVNQNIESLFEQLKSVLKHWTSWLTLETLDSTKLVVWQDWDLHFRASKTFGQEIAKLPSTEEKVGCFIIGLTRLRSDLESHNRSYWDKLMVSLKDSIAEDVVKLQTYVDASTATLNRQPVTVEQIGESDASHANILRHKPQMEELHDSMCLKAKTLASWTREQIDSVNRLLAAWERLQSLLENHEHIIAKQMQTVKTTLNIASENLSKKIESFGAKWDQAKPRPNSGQIAHDSLQQLNGYLGNIKQKRSQWKELLEEKGKIVEDFEKFGMSVPQFLLCDEIDVDLSNMEETWSLFEQFYTDFEKLGNEEWLVFRKKCYLLEEFLFDWQTKLQKLEATPLVTRILKEIHNYQSILPSLKLVRGEDFTETHWMEVQTLLGIIPKPIDALCLKDFLTVSDTFHEKTKELQAICKKAAGEIIVRQALGELNQWEVQSHFTLIDHSDFNKKNIALIKDFKEILNKIGDNQSLLQSVKNAADFDSFSEQAGIWENRLADLEYYLTSLAQIQRKWVYLEPIFGSGTLTHEAPRFERLNRDFRNVLNFIGNDSRVCALLRYSNLRSILENLQDQLVRCQKSLDDFLTEKRDKFPRFLFLGDDDLLEVVGQSSQESVIQSHLKKLFAGIHSINLNRQTNRIAEMCSLEGEVVELDKAVDVNQPVEIWLNSLVGSMQASLKNLLVKCLADGQNVDPLKYPSQILCLADSIMFTSKCEQALNSMTLPPLLATYKTQLNYYSSLELQSDQSQNLGQEGNSNVLELKLKALLLDTIHHINVIEELIEDNVTKASDWTWQKQLRFYTKPPSQEVVVRMANAEMEYSFEYLGNAQKLVRTPLTERCFLTLTQGMFLGMGGNPYGPAGTGKTESVKALGGLLGRQVLVFNCDEGIDASSMGRIISGLVKTGAWGCFDEFNRLDEATLSAISMYIQPIQTALKKKSDKVTLLDREIDLNKHCGIFVTLNPAGGSYGGRNRLPDNLKQLFRPVVMTHPDQEQIAKTLLHCNGYKKADIIASKLVEVFKLSSLLLSKQQHYDWGLRALKTVLNGCGRGMRDRKTKTKSKDLIDDDNFEFALVAGALKMDTLSKLTFGDHRKFEALVSDIFQGVPNEICDNNQLMETLEGSCKDLGLYINNRQLEKCVELHEQLKQRMGVAIIGPPSSGKSTAKKILFHALNKMGLTLKEKVFNPKSLPRAQLLGQIDPDTRQWSDGVLSLYSLQVTSEPQNVWSWITCDGDIDPEWVESLNSVLDDNRLLSLPSGWRIQFGPNVNFIFESHELRNASPATISRMGIVFFSEEIVSMEDYVSNSIAKDVEMSGVLESFYNDYFFKAVNWISNEGELVIPCSKIGIVKTGLAQLEGGASKSEFTVNLINGLGGQLQDDFKEVFAQQVFAWTGEISPSVPERIYYNKEQGNIESYFTKSNLIFEKNTSPLIYTAQVSQAIDTLGKYLVKGKEQHFLLVGPHGSAKSLIIEHLVKTKSETDMAIVHCSAHITSQYLIHKFKQNCIIVNSSRGRVFKPKKGHLVMYFKNLHLLKQDRWGTNMLIEFLQQLITYGGFFDDGLEWVGAENVSIVGSLSATVNLSTRFSSLLRIYNIELPEKEDLHLICSNYLLSSLKEVAPLNDSWFKRKLGKLASTMISIYNEVKETFKSNEYRHYIFSPHEISYWCNNLGRYKNENRPDEVDDFVIEIVCKEALQIFGNKLINDDDRTKLKAILNNVFLSDWGKSYLAEKVANNFFVPSFASSRNESSLSKMTAEDWFDTVKKGVMVYEREGHLLKLLFVPELLNLTASLSWSLTREAGSMLLIGRSGVGRKSAVRIVSALQSAKLVIAGFGKLFYNDLKYAMQQSGIEGEDVFLVLEDHLLSTPVLNTISTLLSSGEVPGLYNHVEFESLISGLRDEASRDGFEGNLGDYFVQRVRKRLHVVICLDINNEKFWEILADYPVLYYKCDAIWQSEWSAKTMDSFPNMLVDKHNKERPNEIVEIYTGFSNIHATMDKTGIATPLRYAELIKNYMRFYVQKRNLVMQRKSKLQAGVDKLTEARTVVADLKLKAAEQQEKLGEKQSKANAALDMITSTMENANSQKQEMEVLKRNTENENELLVKRKKEIERELAEVEPLIKEAGAAVGNIKSEALSEIRSLRAPPDIIRDILEGVLRLMGIQDTSWNSMKIFLAKRGVKEDIRSFDASRITTESRQSVEKLLQNRSDSFDPKSSKRASIAAAPLAAWVTANVRYSHVLDKIKPLTKEQNRLQRNLENAKLQLGELSSGLTSVDDKVAKLKEQLSTYTKEAAEIEIHLGMAQGTLRAAEGLVGKLNDEYDRWQKQLSQLSEEMKRLSSYCLLAAAFITYLSGEPEDTRLKLLDVWKNVIARDDANEFDLEEFLSSERENLQWQSEGLGSDQLSIQNAIIMLNSNIVPLVIDPTSVAFDWIKQHYKSKTLETINENSPKFNTVLELAIRFGKVLIIEDANIAPNLLPILRKEFIYSGERKTVNINGKLIDCHNDFRLILTSRNSQFKLPAYLSSNIMSVNFSITHSGLTEKLLISAIRQENPQLEERRKQLLKEREEMQEKQYNLQNQLLEDLGNSSGNILENKSLLESLNETKASSNAISDALNQSNEIRRKLSEEYDVYKDISAFGSSLYFAIVEFSKMNVLYSISVHSYTNLFLKSLSSSQGIENTFGLLQRVLIQSVYQLVGRGILKADRPKFILHLIRTVYPKQVPDEEWTFFLGQNGNYKADLRNETGVPNWIPEQLHHQIQLLQLSQPNVYATLNLTESTIWKGFMESGACETKFPTHAKLTEFQKVLVIQILRPDRLYSALMQFCLHVTGLKNLNLDVLQLAQVLQESSYSEPILLLTTSGNDPSGEIRELAENKRGVGNYVEIAMGEGQESKAVSSIREANSNGHWIILKNLHLVTSWLPNLLQELQNLSPNPEFRMWLITESQNSFNPVLAQNCLKIAYEAPQGIRNNLLRTYTTWGREYCKDFKPTGARIFFILTCINALLQERRSYIPQGWSKWYDFSDVDLVAAVKLTTPVLSSNNAQVPWKFLKGLCADAIYGGRIENIQDFSILESYLNQFFLDEVLSHRWKPFHLNNSIPLSTKYEDYVDAILQLSQRDVPSYFGLSENIDRSWEKNISQEIIKDLKTLEGSKIQQLTFNRQTWQKGLTPYINLWKKLNQGQDFVKIALKTAAIDPKQSSMLNYIQEEFHNAVFLIQKIHKNFTALNRLLRGSFLPDEKTTELAIDLLNQKVPKSWSKIWTGPSDPNKYLRYVIVKTVKIRNLQSESADHFFTVPMNLSLLFNPETFLAAFKQQYARNHQVPLDELTMQTNWKVTRNSVALEGLLVSGALFDGFLLSSCLSNTESINSAPNCYITWTQKKNTALNDKLLSVPLYYTSERDKQVTQIQVPCDSKEKDKWIKAGLAFFLSY